VNSVQLVFNSVRESYSVLRELVEVCATFSCAPLPDGRLAVSCSPAVYSVLHLPTVAPERPLCRYAAPSFEISCGLRLSLKYDTLWLMICALIDAGKGFALQDEGALDVTADSLSLLDGGIASVRLLPGCAIHLP
jgi:hypothetical protein